MVPMAAFNAPLAAGALVRGSRMPHVQLRRLDGSHFDYGDVWQRRNLLLIALGAGPARDADAPWLEALESDRSACELHEAVVVVTRDAVPGLTAPGVVVVDRWGEVVFAEAAASVSALPATETLVEWLRFVDHACPECEGEAR